MTEEEVRLIVEAASDMARLTHALHQTLAKLATLWTADAIDQVPPDDRDRAEAALRNAAEMLRQMLAVAQRYTSHPGD
jgi:hypothetical protein